MAVAKYWTGSTWTPVSYGAGDIAMLETRVDDLESGAAPIVDTKDFNIPVVADYEYNIGDVDGNALNAIEITGRVTCTVSTFIQLRINNADLSTGDYQSHRFWSQNTPPVQYFSDFNAIVGTAVSGLRGLCLAHTDFAGPFLVFFQSKIWLRTGMYRGSVSQHTCVSYAQNDNQMRAQCHSTWRDQNTPVTNLKLRFHTAGAVMSSGGIIHDLTVRKV